MTAQTEIGGGAMVNGSNISGNPAATYCAGQVPTSAFMTTGTVSTNGNPSIIAPPGGQGAITGVDKAYFKDFTLTDADIAALKVYAQKNGHYYQGSQTFTSPPPNGLLFFDTPSDNSSLNSTVIDMHGNWSQGWSGWMIIRGSADMQGDISLSGLVYILNDVNIHGNGNLNVRGAIIAQDRLDSQSSTIDSDDIGNGKLAYDCPAIRDGGGTINANWSISSYKELAGT